MSTTALTKAGGALVIPPIQKAEDLRICFEQLRQQRVNVVCPVAAIDAILPMHAVSVRAVVIDPTVDAKGNGPEVYKGGFCKGDNERALGNVAIGKIAAAAGVVTLSRRRLDDRSDPFYCEIEVTRGFQEFDGTWRQETKAKAVDLRKGSPGADELAGNPSVLAQARKHIQELAETKAGLRVDRKLLNLRQKYTTAELAQPFMVPKLVPMLDPRNEDERAALIDMATGRNRALYGGPQPSDSPRTIRDIEPAKALPPLDPGPGTPPPPVGTVAKDDEDGEDLGEIVDLAESMPAYVCQCTADDGGLCQAPVTEANAKIAAEQLGGTPEKAARCGDCWPSQRFNFKKHTNGDAILGLPKHPKLDVDGLREKLAAAAKK